MTWQRSSGRLGSTSLSFHLGHLLDDPHLQILPAGSVNRIGHGGGNGDYSRIAVRYEATFRIFFEFAHPPFKKTGSHYHSSDRIRIKRAREWRLVGAAGDLQNCFIAIRLPLERAG